MKCVNSDACAESAYGVETPIERLCTDTLLLQAKQWR